ncbi:hypothetical protein [Streptomyces sp. NPDC001750]|uniref:hypothetical protein n=1 Tax=Streptomyces sp. NPDC001750 TaxID=3364607 RepID=UPI003677D0A7
MSTERPDNDVTGPRDEGSGARRGSPREDAPDGAPGSAPDAAASARPRLPKRSVVVASVAAVLLAGGGGAYWAATAANGDGGSGGGAAAGGGGSAPPPLALDERADVPPAAPDGPPQGIAVGEPDPHGGKVVHRVSGTLPQGPGRAEVRRAVGTVTASEVTRLAKALGLAGTPRAEGTSWTVGSDKDGSGPLLRVDRQAPGTWTFARYGSGGTDDCRRGASVCSSGSTAPDGSGSPVSESAARAAATPVLKAAGLDDAALDSRQVMGSARVVNADPVVDGLPTYGWSTGVQVGPDGDVVGGSGRLKGLEKGDSYPVISAGEALKQLNGSSSRTGRGSGIEGCAEPVPLEGDLKSPGVRCGTRTGAEPPTTTVTIDKAVFGLSMQHVAGEPALVPSWLFSVRSAAGGAGTTLARVAVDPAYLAKAKDAPAAPPGETGGTSGGSRQIQSYSADGRNLSVTFWGGVCGTYAASAAEDGKAVRVTVTESKQEGKKVCVTMAQELTRTVTLDAPLGDRAVIDAASGARVPGA